MAEHHTHAALWSQIIASSHLTAAVQVSRAIKVIFENTYLELHTAAPTLNYRLDSSVLCQETCTSLRIQIPNQYPVSVSKSSCLSSFLSDS